MFGPLPIIITWGHERGSFALLTNMLQQDISTKDPADGKESLMSGELGNHLIKILKRRKASSENLG